ncbi:flavodoxin reductase family [Fusarium beomiforme]|uniref:Flavodoxin reductase family n=1 Tax=Fusarium beomiforme TaxID=44412 RepID=A0A9P5AUR3_9HYPO|nr:flavodoxin reductase family [Fusarium beomiforme]
MAIGLSTRMDVVAVSHSVPQWLNIGGKRIYSSIVHTPFASPDKFIELDPMIGVKGNESAAHNAEVYIFFAHHYDYWSERLNVPREEWDWCHWGENITFCSDPTMTESDFHLGDVWKVGSQVHLQVCGSRVPCFKLSWRCGQKDSWLRELAGSGKCGVYLKVLKGGRVYPGDTAELLRKATNAPLVDCATITRTAFADALSTRSTMNLLVDHPDLLDMNKLVFRRKLSMLHDQSLVGKGSWKGWRRLYVARVVEETPSIKSFYLRSTEDSGLRSLAAYLPGQFLTVRLPNSLIRCWSISTYPDDDQREAPGMYRISIRKAGKASTWMHEKCSVGALLEVQSPAGAFCLDWSPQFPGRQVYVSAGIGITPMMAMFTAHLHHQAMQRAPASWLHVSRDAHSMPFCQELQDLLRTDAAQDLGVSVYLFFTKYNQAECDALARKLSQDKGPKVTIVIRPGKPTYEDLRPIFSEPYFMDPLRITPLEIEGRFSTVYLCGPTHFEEGMRASLAELNVPDAMVLSESFSGARPSGPPKVVQAQVMFRRSKKTVNWRMGSDNKPKNQTPNGSVKVPRTADDSHGTYKLEPGPGPTLLELAEQVGLAPDFGCRTGVCGACEQSLCKGKVTAGLQPGGSVRICIARPGTEHIEIDL